MPNRRQRPGTIVTPASRRRVEVDIGPAEQETRDGRHRVSVGEATVEHVKRDAYSGIVGPSKGGPTDTMRAALQRRAERITRSRGRY